LCEYHVHLVRHPVSYLSGLNGSMPITYPRGILLHLAVFAALLSLHSYSYNSQPRATHSERQLLGGVGGSLAVDYIEGPVRVPGLHCFPVLPANRGVTDGARTRDLRSHNPNRLNLE